MQSRIVRHAGLSDDFVRRLTIASRVASVKQVILRCEPWDGTRCDLAVVAAEDGYGQHVAEIARRRGTPVVSVLLGGIGKVVEGNVAWLSPQAGPREILDALLRALSQPTRDGPALAPGTAKAEPIGATLALDRTSLLALLSQPGAVCNEWMRADCSGIGVVLDRGSGRVCAESQEMLRLAASRAGRSGWSVETSSKTGTEVIFWTSCCSLDGFLLSAALSVRDSLPDSHRESYRLTQWPDLGGMPEAVDALRVVHQIQSRALTVDQITAASGVDAGTVRACLLAFKCAGLLSCQSAETAGSVVPDAEQDETPGVLARLARWVGFRRQTGGPGATKENR